MKNSLLILSCLIITSIVPNAPAYARPGDQSCHHGKWGADSEEAVQKRLDRLSSRLNLDNAQRDQFRDLITSTRNQLKPLRKDKKALRGELKTLEPMAPNFQERLNSIADRKAAITREITLIRGSKKQAMAKILTPEQRSIMKQIHEKRMKHFRHGDSTAKPGE